MVSTSWREISSTEVMRLLLTVADSCARYTQAAPVISSTVTATMAMYFPRFTGILLSG